MRTGRHAAADGSFERSAGTAAVKGAALLAVAVALGIVLLQAADNEDPFTRSVAATKAPQTSPPTFPSSSSSSTTPSTSKTTPAPAPRPPTQVKVLSANATLTRGLGGRVKERLRLAGYNALSPVDTTTKPLKTTVYFAAGFQQEAGGIAALLQLPASAVKPLTPRPPVARTLGANVIVVAGIDLPSAAAPGSTTSTTR